MKKKIHTTFIYGCGGFFVGLGILGLFLPILQGLLFIALGLYILSLRSEKAKRLLDRIVERFPFIRTTGVKCASYARNVSQTISMFL